MTYFALLSLSTFILLNVTQQKTINIYRTQKSSIKQISFSKAVSLKAHTANL